MKEWAIRLVWFGVLPLMGAGWVAWMGGEDGPDETILKEGEIRVQEVSTLGEPILWVDARGKDAYMAGHVPGAIHISSPEDVEGFVALLDVWEPGMPIVVYCDGTLCALSSELAKVLRNEYQLSPVWVLKGRWQDYRGAQ